MGWKWCQKGYWTRVLSFIPPEKFYNPPKQISGYASDAVHLFLLLQAQYTSPTPTQLNSTVGRVGVSGVYWASHMHGRISKASKTCSPNGWHNRPIWPSHRVCLVRPLDIWLLKFIAALFYAVNVSNILLLFINAFDELPDKTTEIRYNLCISHSLLCVCCKFHNNIPNVCQDIANLL